MGGGGGEAVGGGGGGVGGHSGLGLVEGLGVRWDEETEDNASKGGVNGGNGWRVGRVLVSRKGGLICV